VLQRFAARRSCACACAICVKHQSFANKFVGQFGAKIWAVFPGRRRSHYRWCEKKRTVSSKSRCDNASQVREACGCKATGCYMWTISWLRAVCQATIYFHHCVFVHSCKGAQQGKIHIVFLHGVIVRSITVKCVAESVKLMMSNQYTTDAGRYCNAREALLAADSQVSIGVETRTLVGVRTVNGCMHLAADHNHTRFTMQLKASYVADMLGNIAVAKCIAEEPVAGNLKSTHSPWLGIKGII